MRQHMDGVTERNAHDCRSCPYGNSGDTSFNKKIRNRANNPPNSTGVIIKGIDLFRLNTSEMNTIMMIRAMEEVRIVSLFNLAGIVNSYRGTSEIFRTKGRVLFLYLLKFFFQYPDQFIIFSGAAGTEYGVINISKVEPSCEKICSSLIS